MRGNREIKCDVAIIPTDGTVAAVNGPAIDLIGYGVAEFLVNAGTPAAGGTLDVKLQDAIEDPDSPGNPKAADWGDVAGGALPQIVAAGFKVIQVDPRKVKRFVRLVATTAVDKTPRSASCVRRHGTVTQPETVADLVVGFA